MSFHADDAWQRSVRDGLLTPYYRERFHEGRLVYLDQGRLVKFLQKKFAFDTLAELKDGRTVAIEEKIVRCPGHEFKNIFLETESCTTPGMEAPGWMEYGEADYLLYARAVHPEGQKCDAATCRSWCGRCWLDVDLIDFPHLKEWFWENERSFQGYGPVEPPNNSIGKIVPLDAIREAVPCKSFVVQS